MEVGSGVEFLCNKTILVTGATGFLAKVLVEKILRIQPNVKKLYLLIRVQDNKSSLERLQEQVIRKEVFRVLRERQGTEFDSFVSEKVAPIDGDTSLINLGFNQDIEIHKEIDVIIHSAAVTKFQERYDRALGINTLGARNVLQYAKTCPKLQILVHVSTAYVCRQTVGLIPETLCETVGKDDKNHIIEAEKKLIDKTLNDLTSKGASTKEIRDTMKCLGQKRANKYGWANTYSFTKAMAEMLIWDHKGDLPIVILRPTMICSTYKEPFSCWIEGQGSIGMLSIVFGKGLTYFTNANGNSVMDLIPADMVVDSIIMGMVANANKPCLTIYQMGSSLRNPLTLSKLVDINYRYFNQNPWTDSHGKLTKIKRSKLVKSRLHFLMLLVQHIPMFMVSKWVDVASCHHFKVNPDKLAMQLKVSAKMAMIFRHYLFFAGTFDDENTEKLRRAMSQKGLDEEGFNFDPKCIDWEDYLFNNHIPAIVKYMF